MGEVLDGLHLAREAGLPANDTAWDLQRALLDHLEGHDPDNGLWEVRGPRRHFVHSKVMAWAGLDRVVHTVQHHGLPGPVDRWRAVRDRIHAEVCAKGYDADRGTFTQFYGSQGPDAALLLLLPCDGSLPWSDPRVRGTVDAGVAELCDDSTEDALLACTFWLADALHGTGRVDEARDSSSGC